MANDNLQNEAALANALLADELGALYDRVCRMESLVRGAESVLGTIRYDAHLDYTPADGKRTDTHRRAYQMINFLGDQFELLAKDETDLDLPSDEIWELWQRAKDRRLIRYEKPVSESAE